MVVYLFEVHIRCHHFSSIFVLNTLLFYYSHQRFHNLEHKYFSVFVLHRSVSESIPYVVRTHIYMSVFISLYQSQELSNKLHEFYPNLCSFVCHFFEEFSSAFHGLDYGIERNENDTRCLCVCVNS